MKNNASLYICILIMMGATTIGFSQNNTTRTLVAVSKAEHTLSIVDAASLKVITKIPAGPNTHEVVVSENGKTAYISNPGNSDMHEINVIDLEHRKKLDNIDTTPFLGPHGLQLKGNYLWFTSQGSKAVARYNVVTEKMDWSMGTGQDVTHMLYVHSSMEEFYTTNVQSGTVSLFTHKLLPPNVPPTGKLPPNAKPHWDWEQQLVNAKQGVEGFDVSNDEKELWAVAPDGTITIIDLLSKSNIATLETGIKGAHRLQFTPDGLSVIVVSVATGEVVKFDAESHNIIGKTIIAQGGEMLMDEVENRLFIACPIDGYIAVLDIATLKEINRIDVGGRPDGMAWSTF